MIKLFHSKFKKTLSYVEFATTHDIFLAFDIKFVHSVSSEKIIFFLKGKDYRRVKKAGST
jgi:hypothetical protein